MYLSLALLVGCSSLVPPSTPTLSPLAARGRGVFDSYCSRCHGTSGDTVVVGPSLAGVGSRAAKRIEGMAASVYIRDSILNPGAYVVEGFQEGLMPTDFKDQLSPEDLDSVVAYLLTLN
jgi:mono/diheme cytochrome c family protein